MRSKGPKVQGSLLQGLQQSHRGGAGAATEYQHGFTLGFAVVAPMDTVYQPFLRFFE